MIDGVVAHAQRGSGVDPVAVPAALAQRRVDLGGVFAALATDQHVAGGEFAQILRVLQAAAMARFLGRGAADVRRGEKNGLDAGKSFSSRILCMRTLPTIPRHPIIPTPQHGFLRECVYFTSFQPCFAGRNARG